MEINTTHYLSKIQPLLPGFFEVSETLTSKHLEIMCILDEIGVEKFFPDDGDYYGRGRPPKERIPFARAFIAKAVLGISQTKAFIDRLKVDPVLRRVCGWEGYKKVPCEATFSNVFADFSGNDVASAIHENLIKDFYQNKEVQYLNRDSSAIEAREKPEKKEKNTEEKKVKYGRGRPKKDEIRPEKEKTRLEKQQDQSLEEMLDDLPTACNKGVKKNSKGYKIAWNGYKLHTDVTEEGIAISAILTSASLHDSQVSIPLEELSSQRVQSVFTLADAAYDSKIIIKNIEEKNKNSIIDSNPRRLDKKEKTAEEKEHYKERSYVERFFGDIKDNFGGRIIWVKGHKKIFSYLMFSILAQTGKKLAYSRF